MIDKPTPSQGLNISIATIIPIKGRGFMHHRFGLYGFGAARQLGMNGACRLLRYDQAARFQQKIKQLEAVRVHVVGVSGGLSK